MRHLAIIATAALTGCGGLVDIHDREGEERLTIHYDEGGSIARYRNEVNRARFYETEVHIAGPCISACTMYLALGPDQLTLRPDAELHFHRGGATDEGLKVLAEHYPPNTRAWFLEKAARHGFTSLPKTGAELKEMDPDYIRLRE